MKDYEYNKLWEQGQKEFMQIDHTSVLKEKIDKNLKNIVYFPENLLSSPIGETFLHSLRYFNQQYLSKITVQDTYLLAW